MLFTRIFESTDWRGYTHTKHTYLYIYIYIYVYVYELAGPLCKIAKKRSEQAGCYDRWGATLHVFGFWIID